MLITFSTTVFFLVCTPLVAIRFGKSVQLVSSDLLAMAVVVRRES
jgi:hypothetical protein